MHSSVVNTAPLVNGLTYVMGVCGASFGHGSGWFAAQLIWRSIYNKQWDLRLRQLAGMGSSCPCNDETSVCSMQPRRLTVPNVVAE